MLAVGVIFTPKAKPKERRGQIVAVDDDDGQGVIFTKAKNCQSPDQPNFLIYAYSGYTVGPAFVVHTYGVQDGGFSFLNVNRNIVLYPSIF